MECSAIGPGNELAGGSERDVLPSKAVMDLKQQIGFCVLTALASLVHATAAERTTNGLQLEFREPTPLSYWIETPPIATAASNIRTTAWLRAWSLAQPDRTPVHVGNRIVLELSDERDLAPLLAGRTLKISQVLTPRMFILEAPETLAALRDAAALATDPRVAASYPIARRPVQLLGNYAPRPNDPYLFRPSLAGSDWQPYLENRSVDGLQLGPDLNVRSAWATTRGENVVIAVGDDGIDLNHPELSPRATNAPHFNFVQLTADGFPSGSQANHGTAVAGLALATADNGIGIAGVAPQARLASWVIFNASDNLGLAEDVMMNMFQYRSNVVSIQNHSWGNNESSQLSVSSLISLGISNAVTSGRAGRGVVIIRAAGNGRDTLYNANDDGYLADPRVVTVAAARLDGRVARYSNPGANVLVAAFGGDQEAEFNPCLPNSPNLLTTDRVGAIGFNEVLSSDSRGDYTFDGTQFKGTSAATPQIAGVAALMLGANSNLTHRDVQQILIHSAKHYDFLDPDLITNAAGFRVSHNLGFGIPDAGLAVRLARTWPRRPALTNTTISTTVIRNVPDIGLRLEVQGSNVPEGLSSILTLPGAGILPDQPTLTVPMVNVGTTVGGISVNLHGKAALIQRGTIFFCEKLANAATAGAAFAVVYNNEDAPARVQMISTDFSPIPGVSISKQDGEALSDYLAVHPEALTRLRLTTTNYTFNVQANILCEQVMLQVNSDHSARGDLRITLTSPRGTRSILQTCGNDKSRGPNSWKYMTVHNFYEDSRGTWTVEVSDLNTSGTGRILSVGLTVYGVPITDQDLDGLDDAWELARFGSLSHGAQEDADGDGFNNMREQIMGTNPTLNETPFLAELGLWDNQVGRLTWPSTEAARYDVLGGANVSSLTRLTNLAGQFPQTEFIFPVTPESNQFFRLRSIPNGASP